MPSNNRARVKGRSSGTFAALPHHVFRSSGDKPPPVAVLTNSARLLLVDLCQQMNGRSNGNLSAAPKILEPYGWTSRGTLDAALVELVATGFLVQTRQGGRNRCSLYAVTWTGIDEGPHDSKPDPVPLRLWESEKAGLRDEAFLKRWRAIGRRRDKKISSRASDKPSRASDKSGSTEAA